MLLPCALDPRWTRAGEWLTVVANTNCHTFEVAPVFTLVETEVLTKLARLIGGPYKEAHDGLFVPGGSIANLYGAQPYARHSCSVED